MDDMLELMKEKPEVEKFNAAKESSSPFTNSGIFRLKNFKPKNLPKFCSTEWTLRLLVYRSRNQFSRCLTAQQLSIISLGKGKSNFATSTFTTIPISRYWKEFPSQWSRERQWLWYISVRKYYRHSFYVLNKLSTVGRSLWGRKEHHYPSVISLLSADFRRDFFRRSGCERTEEKEPSSAHWRRATGYRTLQRYYRVKLSFTYISDRKFSFSRELTKQCFEKNPIIQCKQKCIPKIVTLKFKVHLFSYNIHYGNTAASDAQIVQAAKAADIHEKIKSLPNGR